jgi:hypothetical protein
MLLRPWLSMYTVRGVLSCLRQLLWMCIVRTFFVSCLCSLIQCSLSELLFLVCAHWYQCVLSQMCISCLRPLLSMCIDRTVCLLLAHITFNVHCQSYCFLMSIRIVRLSEKCLFFLGAHFFYCTLQEKMLIYCLGPVILFRTLFFKFYMSCSRRNEFNFHFQAYA